MIRVLRLAACAFAITPAQLWPNVLGLGFLLPALVFPGRPWSGPVSVIGLLFIGIIPMLLGGPSMRVIAAHRSFRLRPHGPRQLVLAASVLIVAFAAFSVALVAHTGAAVPGRTPPAFGATFLVLLSALALAWVYTFAMAGTRALFYVGLVVLFGIRYWMPYALRLPEPLLVLGGAALVAWAWLAYRLTHPRGVSVRVPFSGRSDFGGSSGGMGRNVTPWAGVRLYLLGSTSNWPFFVPMVTLLGFTLLAATGWFTGMLPGFLLLVAPLSLVGTGQAGFTVARRARFLWLRRGTDRREAFDLTERAALFGYAASCAGVTVVFALVIALFLPHEEWLQAGAFWLIHLLMTLCFLYLGLLYIRGWSGPAILGGIGMLGLWIGCLAASRPGAEDAAMWTQVLVPALTALAFGLRTAARWRWQRIDWLVLRPPKLPFEGR